MAKRVLIALRMAGVAGQDKFSGIFRRIGENHDWDMRFVRSASAFTPQCVRDALAGGYDGFIVSIPDTESSAALLAESDVPTVVMDVHDPALSARKHNIVFIRNSAKEIGSAAANHLLTTGKCRSYAFVHNPDVVQWSVDRFAAFRDTLMDRGFWCHELHSCDKLAKLEKPVGVFAANDAAGFDVLEHCRALRLRVPEDVLVLAINNDTLICENSRPRLSSIQPDFEQEGYLAADVLDSMMRERETSPKTFKVPARTLFVGVKSIVRRESTAETSPSGKLVQKAIAFIRQNARKGISVGDVVRHVGCSRRLAELRFGELQGTSIGETIISTRLAEVRNLLATTSLPIEAIAGECGYENPNYLKNLFKKRFGMTMRDFRKSGGNV